jgi:hypothetical protein
VKLLRQSWDFLFGVLLVGGLPVGAFVTVASAASWLLRGFGQSGSFTFLHAIVVALAIAMSLAVPVDVLVVAARWRIRHRLLPVWMMWVEVPVGVVAGAGFVFFTAAMEVFGDPNW